jgi:hypothetical protein
MNVSVTLFPNKLLIGSQFDISLMFSVKKTLVPLVAPALAKFCHMGDCLVHMDIFKKLKQAAQTSGQYLPRSESCIAI